MTELAKKVVAESIREFQEDTFFKLYKKYKEDNDSYFCVVDFVWKKYEDLDTQSLFVGCTLIMFGLAENSPAPMLKCSTKKFIEILTWVRHEASTNEVKGGWLVSAHDEIRNKSLKDQVLIVLKDLAYNPEKLVKCADTILEEYKDSN